MAIAGNLQADASGQKFAGPIDPTDGTGKALRGANIDQTEGYADAQVALMDHNNANLDKADDSVVVPGTVRVIPVGCMADETAPDSVDEGDVGIPRMTLNRLLRVIDTNLAGHNRSYRAKTTLLAEVARATTATVAGDPVTGFGGYKELVALLTVSGKSLAGGGTLNVYVQTSPDDGTTWDDVISFTQITNAAVADGTYLARICNNAAAGETDRANKDGTLTANQKVDYFCDQLRVKTVGASMGEDDTVTVKVEVVAIG